MYVCSLTQEDGLVKIGGKRVKKTTFWKGKQWRKKVFMSIYRITEKNIIILKKGFEKSPKYVYNRYGGLYGTPLM